MKHEWRKHEKGMYLPRCLPELINVPKMQFVIIKGKGDPNSPHFQEEIGALYALSYIAKFDAKNSKGWDYTVYPLEGVWDLDEEGRKKDYLDKSNFMYEIMIRQRNFMTKEDFENYKEKCRNKVPSELLERLEFKEIHEGLAVQCLHIGSYDNEPETFSYMDEYCEQNNLERIDKRHREIYLTDARKVEPSKYKTVLRYKVNKK